LRSCKNQIELYREENIPLFTKLEEDSQQYGAIASKMSISYQGKEYTLQQASKFLKQKDRKVREKVYALIQKRRSADTGQLNELFDHLIGLRQKVAENAGFNNYRDYKFRALERFDYDVNDCEALHKSIKQTVVPILDEINEYRKSCLGIEKLRPWDTSVDLEGKNPLTPFEGEKELIEKSIQCFDQIDPYFGDCIRAMRDQNHLDLESKKGKAPGGFNYPLFESGLPFIYMNAVGSMRDVTTMIHEGGHAVHSVLCHPLELVDFKSTPSEVAELASMSMELISMDYWDVFYENEEDLNRAKRDQLLDVLNTLPWVATIDKFQHWVYTNLDHPLEERYEYWNKLMSEFGSNAIDWKGYEAARSNLWQKQLHLFEVPFYYIEYGIAQLGAIALWKNYRNQPQETIEKFKAALSLGYTRSIKDIYKTAGIKFDFSAAYVSELMEFIKTEVDQILYTQS
jgi:oligoendopeptidase F